MQELQHDPALDRDLVIRAQGGDGDALDQLIRRHLPWVLHLAQRMMWDRADAEDATQEILIKAVTRLVGFEARAEFRTWLYRIAANHVLDRCRAAKSFQGIARSLSDMPDKELPEAGAGGVERALLIEEAKIACTTGMLLCLKPRQRLAFILGEILGVDDQVGSVVLDTTPGNFRQLLSRARGALYAFLSRQCGLVNQRNHCRCANKAIGFINKGWVQTAQLQFVDRRRLAVQRVAPDRMHDLEDLERRHALIFRDQPLLAPRAGAAAVIQAVAGLRYSQQHGVRPMMATSETHDLVQRLGMLPVYLERLAHEAPGRDTRRSPSSGGFSLLEHACHLRDYEREGVLSRIERILARDRPVLPDFPGARLAVERRYHDQDFRKAVREFLLNRSRTLQRIQTLSEEQLTRTARLGTVGIVTTRQLLRILAEHDATHRREIDDLLREQCGTEAEDVTALRQMAREFTDGFNAGDLDRLMRFYGDTYVDINLRQPVQSHGERRAYYAALMRRGGFRIDVHPDEIVVEGDLAFVRGRIEILTPDASGGADTVKELRYLEIDRKSSDGSWKAVWGVDGPVQEYEPEIPPTCGHRSE